VAPHVGWRACLIGSSATAFLAFLARRGMPESDLWQQGGAPRCGAGLGRLLSGDLTPRFLQGLVLTALNMSAYWFTYSWLPSYLQARGLSLARSGLYYSVILGGELAGYLSFGWVSDRLGRRPAFTLFSVTMAVGLLPLTYLWEHFAGRPLLIFSAMLLVGLGTGTWSNFGPLLAELFPTPLRNTAMGSILNLARGTQFLAPMLIAALEPRFGLAAGIGLAAFFALSAGGWIWTFPETRGRAL
jgi:MFS family permease